jgi:MFS family permease
MPECVLVSLCSARQPRSREGNAGWQHNDDAQVLSLDADFAALRPIYARVAPALVRMTPVDAAVRADTGGRSSRATQEFNSHSVKVLAGAMVCALLMPAVLATTVFPVVMPRMASEFHWTRTQASLATSLLQVGVMINSPVMGLLIRRWGATACATPALLVSGALLFTAGLAAQTGLGAYCAVYAFVGLSTAGYMPCYALVSGWFHRRRALALGFIAVGGTSTVMVLPLLANEALNHFGWRTLYCLLGGAVFCMIPVFWVTAREHPDSTAHRQRETSLKKGPLRSLAGIMGKRTFWLLAAGQAMATGANSSAIAHSVSMMLDHGFNRTFGAAVASSIGLGALLSSAISGIVLDRFDTPKAITPFALTAVIGVAFLQWAPSEAVALLGGVLVGLGAAGEASHLAYFVTRFFGRENYSQTYGAIMPLQTGLSAVIPVILGASFDAVGSYRVGYGILEGLYFLSLVLFWLLGPYRYSATAVETLEDSPAPSE